MFKLLAKLLAKCSGKFTFFRVSWVPKQCTRIFKVSNAWTNLWNHMMEETAGVKTQKSKKGIKKNGHSFSVEGIFLVSDSTARQSLKLAGPTLTNQSSSKLWKFRKWQAEISDTQLRLTGIANHFMYEFITWIFIWIHDSPWRILLIHISHIILTYEYYMTVDYQGSRSRCGEPKQCTSCKGRKQCQWLDWGLALE